MRLLYNFYQPLMLPSLDNFIKKNRRKNNSADSFLIYHQFLSLLFQIEFIINIIIILLTTSRKEFQFINLPTANY